MKRISLTIGIPTIGDNDFIFAAVASALAELPVDGEIIVSDNAGLAPETVRRLSEIDPLGRLRIVRQAERISMGDNWNCCLREARGDFFILLSDDDLLLSGFVQEACGFLSDESFSMVVSRINWINESGKSFWVSPPVPPQEACVELLFGVFAKKRVVLPCATMFRRKELLAVGGYDSSYGNWADMKAWVAVGAAYGPAKLINKPLAAYRERLSSLTKSVNDKAWRDAMEKTVFFAASVLPEKSSEVLIKGRVYVEYMLADIKMKRCLGGAESLWQASRLTWIACAALPFDNKIWLLMKMVFLRLKASRS